MAEESAVESLSPWVPSAREFNDQQKLQLSAKHLPRRCGNPSGDRAGGRAEAILSQSVRRAVSELRYRLVRVARLRDFGDGLEGSFRHF